MLASLLFAFAVFAGTGVSAQENADGANYCRYAEANKTAQRGADAVFMGNSITQGWANSRPDFLADNNYIGRGIGGQVTAQTHVRFRADVH